MSTVHCPLCGLRYTWVSELDGHVRDEHGPPPEVHVPPPPREHHDRWATHRPASPQR